LVGCDNEEIYGCMSEESKKMVLQQENLNQDPTLDFCGSCFPSPRGSWIIKKKIRNDGREGIFFRCSLKVVQ
jgi:hypothetical protein